MAIIWLHPPLPSPVRARHKFARDASLPEGMFCTPNRSNSPPAGNIILKFCTKPAAVTIICLSPGSPPGGERVVIPVSSSHRSNRNRRKGSDENLNHWEGTRTGQVAGHACDRRGSRRDPQSTLCTVRSIPSFARRKHRPSPSAGRRTS